MGKWNKYQKHYNPDWEKLPAFKNWLQKTPETLLKLGQGEAFCKLCRTPLRPHKTDLLDHSKTKKHQEKENALPGKSQPTLASYGIRSKSNESKIIDLKLAVHIACHSSVKSIDHLGELLTDIGQGSKLTELRLHRTKCSKIICKVLAPSMLKELIDDINCHESFFSIIMDESTDQTAHKYLALIVKYFSFAKMEMVTDFLAILDTPQATAVKLYEAFKGFILKVGLRLDRMVGLGTDGASNLCGAHNSVFALLKRNDCPKLQLVKCICHGLDKCSSKASTCFPNTLIYLVRESRGWFSHSALRKFQYDTLYQSLTGGKAPPQLVRIGVTRWLAWYGGVRAHVDQYMELKTLFRKVANEESDCFMAAQLATLHEDYSHLLYLRFLQPILKDITVTNVVFQSSSADVSKVYRDLKALILSLASRVIKPEALKESRPGMLRLCELDALKVALLRKENLKALDQVDFGISFRNLQLELKLPEQKLREVQANCANFIVRFLKEVVDRLPSCIAAIEKMRFFSPSLALAKHGRANFIDLPLDIVDQKLNLEDVECQWRQLGSLHLTDICPDENEVEDVDIIKFWAHVWKMKNGAGKQIFKNLAGYVLAALSLPLSNAVVERLFSILALVKTKIRNKLGLEMLEAILRIRTHLQTSNICCNSFQPSRFMVENFNAKTMYGEKKDKGGDNQGQSEPAVSGGSVTADQVEEVPVPIPVGLTIEDIDDDVHTACIPEWDEMLNLVAEVDAFMENSDIAE